MDQFFLSFSILSRIEASAAILLKVRVSIPLELSVSSVGSKPLPPCWANIQNFPHGIFQYPQSDRSLCRKAGRPISWRRAGSFSILSRIEASAALASIRGPGARLTFSILSRIEASAADSVLDYIYDAIQAFSILSRIEASAAHMEGDMDPIERGLSVSSVGSKPLPRWRRLHTQVADVPLSVSSVGSKPLPPVCAPNVICGHLTFSILSRIEASAAHLDDMEMVNNHLFQYPQSDRSLCRFCAH